MVDRSEGNRQYTEDDIGIFVTLVREDGTYVEAEIVRVFCPLCGEELSLIHISEPTRPY